MLQRNKWFRIGNEQSAASLHHRWLYRGRQRTAVFFGIAKRMGYPFFGITDLQYTERAYRIRYWTRYSRWTHPRRYFQRIRYNHRTSEEMDSLGYITKASPRKVFNNCFGHSCNRWKKKNLLPRPDISNERDAWRRNFTTSIPRTTRLHGEIISNVSVFTDCIPRDNFNPEWYSARNDKFSLRCQQNNPAEPIERTFDSNISLSIQ